MIARNGTDATNRPGLPFRLLLVTCGVNAGLVAPFHLFTRTRGYFENATALDFTLIGIGLLAGIAVLALCKGRSFWTLAAGAAGMSMIACLTIVHYPVLEYTSQTLPRVVFFGMESQPMALNYAAIVFLAIVLCGGTFDAMSRSGGKGAATLFPPALVLGAGIHLLITTFLPSTTGIMASIAGTAAVLVAALGRSYGVLQSWLHGIPPRLQAPGGKRAFLSITAVISWLLAAGTQAIAMLVFFGTLKQPGDLARGTLMFGNVVAGAAIGVALVPIAARWRVVGSIVSLVAGVTSTAILFLSASTGTLASFPITVLGLTIALSSWHAITELFSANARGTAGVLLLVSWFAAAYLAFIPIKFPDILGFSSWIYAALALVLVVGLLLSALRAHLVGAGSLPICSKTAA